MDCFPFETLVSFTEGTLDTGTVPLVSAHLEAGCVACRETVGWLRLTTDAMRTDGLQEPPREAVDRLLHHYAKQFSKKSPGESVRRLVEAMLVFDSDQHLAFSGARDVRSSGKQFLYQADPYDVDLRFYAAATHDFTDIVGQVLAYADPFDRVSGIPVHLCAGEAPLLSTLTDTLGVFHLRRIPEGCYNVKVLLPDHEVTIRGVSVSRPA